jgi:Large eukaryotic DNA virus major capsid protein/Major capsid protein N-terminus
MAGRASLAYLGQEDFPLTSDPEVTYFIERYTGQTPFASRTDRIQFKNGVIVFGEEVIITIPKTADLITSIYLKFPTWPILSSLILDSTGTLLLKYVEFYIGEQLIERLYGEYIECILDLEVPQSQQSALNTLIGKTGIPINPNNVSNFTIPLPFSCLKKGLPICAFNEPITMRLSFNPSSYFTSPQVIYTLPVISHLMVEYTYLSDGEVSFIKSKPMNYIIEQVQRHEFFAPVQALNGVAVSNVVTQCYLNFVNPVKELFFVIQNDSAYGYDFGAETTEIPTVVTQFGIKDQLQQMVLYFNNTERITGDVGTPLFLSTIQALEYHTRNPTRLFYTYSFSLDPESDQPAGSVNMSRIQNQTLQLTLSPTLTNRYIRVYARSYNFLLFYKNNFQLIFPNIETS